MDFIVEIFDETVISTVLDGMVDGVYREEKICVIYLVKSFDCIEYG